MILNLLDRMKLPFRKNKEFLTALYNILGFYPHNIEVYRTAFAHKSLPYRKEANNKDRKGKERKHRSENTSKPLNNERLEYLGDAVLETVVSDILFKHYPNKREGFLTSTRSKIVQREALNKLAADMGLEALIQAAQGTKMAHTNIGGNAFEALMGAIYLDRGFHHCHWFIANRVIGRFINLDNVAQKEVNFKSKLLEWSQKNRINLCFKDTAVEGDERGFKSAITIEGIIVGRGNGRSKKESQQAAAKEALTRMRRDEKVYDSIFRAKEKRTAMEAEESFALPKIDEIEQELNKNGSQKSNEAPVLEENLNKQRISESDAAYDTAYDENAKFEVIDTAPAEPILTEEDYLAKGLPAPPAENDMELDEEPVKQPKKRKHMPKTVNEAVKDFVKKGQQPNNKQTNNNTQNIQVDSPDKGNKQDTQATPKQEKEVNDTVKNNPQNEIPVQELNLPVEQDQTEQLNQQDSVSAVEATLCETAIQLELAEDSVTNDSNTTEQTEKQPTVEEVITTDQQTELAEETATADNTANELSELLVDIAKAATQKEPTENKIIEEDSMSTVTETSTVNNIVEASTTEKPAEIIENKDEVLPEENTVEEVTNKENEIIPRIDLVETKLLAEDTTNSTKQQTDFASEEEPSTEEPAAETVKTDIESTEESTVNTETNVDMADFGTVIPITDLSETIQTEKDEEKVEVAQISNEGNTDTSVKSEEDNRDKPETEETSVENVGTDEAEEPVIIITKDLLPIEDSTEEIIQESETQTKPDTESINLEVPKPILRHLTLDDFVFGMEHETPIDPFDYPETDLSKEQETAKSGKSHKRRRRSKKNKPAEQNDKNKQSLDSQPSESHDSANENGKENKPRSKSRHRRRKPAKKTNEQE